MQQAERYCTACLTFLCRIAAPASVAPHQPASAARPAGRAGAETAAALCTALRCLESVCARPALLPLPSHVVARALQAPALLFEGAQGAAAGVESFTP